MGNQTVRVLRVSPEVGLSEVPLARGWVRASPHLALGGGCQGRGQVVVAVE